MQPYIVQPMELYSAPEADLQNLRFSFKKFTNGVKNGVRDTAKFAKSAAPIISVVAGPEAGAAAGTFGQIGSRIHLQNMQAPASYAYVQQPNVYLI